MGLPVERRIKKALRWLLARRAINVVFIRLVKLLSFLVPDRLKVRFPVVGIISVTYPQGGTIRIRSRGNDCIAHQLYWLGWSAYEADTMAVFLRLLPYCRTVFDIGANTGIYGISAAVHEPDCRVWAFEPVPQVYGQLVENVELNELANVVTVNSAVSDFDGEIELFVPRATMLPTAASTLQGFRSLTRKIRVPAQTLDTYVGGNGISQVDLIKMDTEGTEHRVLHGSRRLLGSQKPLIITEVLRGRTELQLEAALTRFGYRYFWITSDGLLERSRIVGDPSYEHMNYLMATAERLPQIRQYIRATEND